MNGVTAIRPSMTMVADVLCRVHAYESWILNDCAIALTKEGRFLALIFVDLEEFHVIYYGCIHNLHPRISHSDARKKLDRACENHEALPADVFIEKVDWAHVEEGNRYYP